jgi:EAL domain-containing protein (putative c-di-GMP-specific phosphodiesterase class I)
MMELANLLLIEIRQQFVIDSISLTVDASIGITTRQATDTSSGELLRRADVAMYEAKEGRTNIALYDPDTDEFSRERLSLADELRRAIDDNQLVLWYQLQLDASTGMICGFEGLVRWQHPSRGLLSPAEFLPVARRCGLMQALSDEIGRIAVQDLVKWRNEGASPKIALNIAAPELLSGIMVPRLATLLDVAGLPTCNVLLEVTEDLFLADPERARSELLRIQGFGFEISIDDYGSGFSSLSYLRDLPISELKLDRSFVTTACTDARTQMIAASTLRMAAALGLRSVVEGVEDAATAAEFVRLGADVLQGFHLSRPVPPEQVPDLLRTYRAVRYPESDYRTEPGAAEAAAS